MISLDDVVTAVIAITLDTEYDEADCGTRWHEQTIGNGETGTWSEWTIVG